MSALRSDGFPSASGRGPLHVAVMLLIATLVVGCPFAASAALVGITYAGEVWRIDESTGAFERTGTTGHQGENALALDPAGTLYSAASVPGAALETIDPLTGVGTLGPNLNYAVPRGMAFSSGGVLYATDAGLSSSDSGALLRIDVGTGVVTRIGPLGVTTIQALDFGPDGRLYGMVANRLGTIDLTTGHFSTLRTFAAVSNVQSFVFLPSGKIVGGGTMLYEMDPATGATREIGQLGQEFRGFAILPNLPEPPPPASQDSRMAFQIAEFDGPLRRHFVTIGSVAYFETSDPANGTALWKSDGTPAGTQLLKIVDPVYSCCPQYDPLARVGATLFFEAYEPSTGYELWKSDGTAGGTQIVKDLVPGSGSGGASGGGSGQLEAAGDKLFFLGTDAHLFVSDGTATGTQLVAHPLFGDVGFAHPFDLANVNGALFFNWEFAPDRTFGMWRTDGTAAGTWQVGGSGSELTDVDGTLFFVRSRFGEASIIHELWKSDGTADGAVLVKEVGPEFEPQGSYFGPHELTNANGVLFFNAQYSTNESQLWRSDGTSEGTERVTRVSNAASNPGWLTNADGTLFFTSDYGSSGRELWSSDGTDSGTHLVKDIRPGTGGSDPSELADVGGRLVFTACDDVAGCEPWVTMPGYPGAVRIADIAPGVLSSNASDFTRVAKIVLFRVHRGTDFEEKWELWAVPISALRLECSDGIDNDGDGLIDFDGGSSANGGVPLGFADPGCFDGSLSSTEAPPCQDGKDDDGDGKIDFDGGASANHGVPLAAADPDCTQTWRNTEQPSACGLGAELALVMPLLVVLQRRFRRRRACGSV